MKVSNLRHSGPFMPSELVLNRDGAIYHLGLHPDQIAEKIIVVGDPARVGRISNRFDSIEHRVSSREFVTHTGRVGDMRISAVSTGIGVDNVDITLNELDALHNIDLNSREEKTKKTSLDIIRIGTSGAVNADIEVGSFVVSNYALGLDAVMHYYDCQYEEDELALAEAFMEHVNWRLGGIKPYAVKGSDALSNYFPPGQFHHGITATACGFYGPQGRRLRLAPAMADLNEKMSDFNFRGLPLANYEMESSALFGLGAALGHRCTTTCAVIANRLRNEFLSDYKPAVDQLIEKVLSALTSH